MNMEQYFDYIPTANRILRKLEEEYGCTFGLYLQEGQGDIWDDVSEDILGGSPEAEHVMSIYDLVETRRFVSRTDDDALKVDFGPTLRNNVFCYPRFGIAFARIPMLRAHGIGLEDIVYAKDDESLLLMLKDLRERQLNDRRIGVFTDTREGLSRTREKIAYGVSRDEVVLDEGLKKQIFRSIDEFFSNDRSFFQTYGVPYKRGILLYGSPGNGKTTLVKSIVGSIDAPVNYWQITEYTSSESIQEVFAAATRLAPTVLVIEDIDSMPESCRSYFLNTLDGATSKDGIFLIGTTNYPEKIDPALMNRAGRFDRAYEVKLPDESLRFAYLTLRGMRKFADEPAVAYAARRTGGFSLAQLGELYVALALQAHDEGAIDVDLMVMEMKADLSKDRKGAWLSKEEDRDKVGFVV
ncbi:AAA family ATPase [Cohnella suwonensis]|uniref:AAA family ATPase n=1 Tax=Cohnella suwonensis TaxID=696072 RepID=A0ABW0M1H1_9BACL